MTEQDWQANQFEANRSHLRAVAYRMLGSVSEADDAVQECWLRLSRTGTSGVTNLGGWLTTVVARICLDMLRSRTSRREDSLSDRIIEPVARRDNGNDPEHEAMLADAVGLAMLVVLESLAPAERVAFVLHDIFGVPFEEIATIVDRSPGAARQLASRARRRVQGGSTATAADIARHRAVVDAFLSAARGGDLATLLTLLDPGVTLRADQAALQAGAAEATGAAAVAEFFTGRARAARIALLNGEVGAVWAPGGQARVVFGFTIAGGRISEITLKADPGVIRDIDWVTLDA